MAKSKTPAVEPVVVESLTNDLLKSLNIKFKNQPDKAAFFLNDPNVTSDVHNWIPSGNDILDIAISNRPNGGWPVGRIVELTGLEASGKSLLAAHALKNTQALGGVAVYIDTESAVSEQFLSAIGVDIPKLIYMPMDALENIFEAVETIISKVRESNKDRLVTIVIDSIMGASTLAELESTYEKDGYATSKAIILSKAMRKLPLLIARENILLMMTNQLRVNLGVSFGEKYSTSGGKAVGFAASVRVRLTNKNKIKIKQENGLEAIVGIKTNVKITKNRLGPPLRDVDYDIYFDSGVDNYGSWLETLKDYKVVTSGTNWSLPLTGDLVGIELIDPTTGEIKTFSDGVMKFKSKDFKQWLLANPKFKDILYNILCEKLIMKYKINEDFGIDDISYEIDDNDE